MNNNCLICRGPIDPTAPPAPGVTLCAPCYALAGLENAVGKERLTHELAASARDRYAQRVYVAGGNPTALRSHFRLLFPPR